MNMQALMKQAQAMQKKMLESKQKIDEKIFEGNSELVNIKMNGKREVLSVELKNMDDFEKDDVEVLQDMITIAINDVLKKIEREYNDVLGSQTNLPGGFF